MITQIFRNDHTKQVIPPIPVKLKPFKNPCVLPKLDRQTVHCLKKIDGKPALFEMKFKKLPSMTLEDFKDIESKISSNKPFNEVEGLMWHSLGTRAEKNTGNRLF